MRLFYNSFPSATCTLIKSICYVLLLIFPLPLSAFGTPLTVLHYSTHVSQCLINSINPFSDLASTHAFQPSQTRPLKCWRQEVNSDLRHAAHCVAYTTTATIQQFCSNFFYKFQLFCTFYSLVEASLPL